MTVEYVVWNKDTFDEYTFDTFEHAEEFLKEASQIYLSNWALCMHMFYA